MTAPGTLLRATRWRQKARDRVSGALVVIPDGVLTVALFVIPILLIVLYSFWQMNLMTFQVDAIWNLDNYRAVANPIYLSALGRSVGITLFTVAGCILLGVPLAYVIARAKGVAQALLLVAIIVPFWTSFVVRTYAWLTLLGPEGGPLHFLISLGVVPAGTDLRYTNFAIAIGMIYSYLPLMILPVYSTLEKMDPALMDASADLGKSRTTTFFRIVLPEARGGILAGCLLVGIPALGEYTIPAILGGGKTLMLGNVIASEFLGTGNYSRGASLAVVLMLIVIVIIGISRIKLGRKRAGGML